MVADIETRSEPPLPERQKRTLLSGVRQLRELGLGTSVHRIAARARNRYQVARYDLNLRRLVHRPENVKIDRPIFILGVQGGGGTIVARTLYRHPNVVYATGNSQYWAGMDEIHNCHHTMRDLPESLVHRSAHFFNVDGRLEDHAVYGYQRAWLYAVDELLPSYRRTAADADQATALRLRRVIGKTLLAYAHDLSSARFVDMSQLFTIQMRYIAELLRDCDPRFILLTRNPYITVARAARKEYNDQGTRVLLSPQQRLSCAIEHWDNSYRMALDDSDGIPMIQVKYEDFLESPEREIRRMCEFAELEFDPRQVPGPGQPIPLGSLSADKWYPLRRQENVRYQRDLDPEFIAALNARSSDIIERLKYERLE